jgi:phage gp45-like
MIDPALLTAIRREIAKQVNIVLSGLSGSNDSLTEDINAIYPGAPTFQGRPIMHPYGLVSRSPTGTLQVTARVGDHPGARMVLGHRDADRPSVNQGEVQLYNQFGQAIYLKDGEIHIGKPTSSDPVPLGTELSAFLTSFITLFENHSHTGNLGFPTPLDPGDMASAANLKANNLDNKAILSDYIFVEKSP